MEMFGTIATTSPYKAVEELLQLVLAGCHPDIKAMDSVFHLFILLLTKLLGQYKTFNSTRNRQATLRQDIPERGVSFTADQDSRGRKPADCRKLTAFTTLTQ
jgi:hypothetical protein